MATILALLVTSAVAGAAGGYLILGAANSAGTSNTSLTTSSTGTALLVTQTSTGTALRGVAGVGIAGFFTSGSGAGVSGVVGNANNYGVYAANDSASTGTGAALRAAGKNNYALVASSDDKPPIKVSGPGNMAPFELNSSIKVTNLNADLLDGLNSTQLARTDQSQHYSCAGADMPDNGPADYSACLVHLPDGATVTGFAADVYDNTADFGMHCGLSRVTSNGTLSYLANTPGSGTAELPGFTTLVDATIVSPVIDNATYAYTAECYDEGATGSDPAVVKVTVTYTGAP